MIIGEFQYRLSKLLVDLIDVSFRLETLLSVYPPVEILFDRSRAFPGLSHVLQKSCGTSCRAFAFPAAKKTLKMLAEADYFDAKGMSPFEAWPKGLVEHLDEGY